MFSKPGGADGVQNTADRMLCPSASTIHLFTYPCRFKRTLSVKVQRLTREYEAFKKLWKTHIFGRNIKVSAAGCAPTGQVEPCLIAYVSQASLLQ